jgi:potassium-dependent mechanosensitive channel
LNRIRSLHPLLPLPLCKAVWCNLLRGVFLRLLICFLVSVSAVHAQSTSDAQITAAEQRIDALGARIKMVREALASPGLSDESLQTQKGTIESVQLDIAAETSKLTGPLSEVDAQLARLGPPPTEGTNESTAIAAQRRILATRSAQLAAEQKQLELLNLESSQNLSRIGVMQREQFFERIFKSDRTAFNPRLWLETLSGLGHLGAGVVQTFVQAAQQAAPSPNYPGLLLFPFGGALLFVIRRFVVDRFRSTAGAGDPAESRQMSSLHRLWRVFVGLLVLWLVVSLGLILLFSSLDAANLMTTRVSIVLLSFARALMATVLAAGLTYLLCAPRRPEARLIAVDEKSARLLPILVGAAVLAFRFGGTVSDLSDTLQLPLSALPGVSALSAGAMIALIGMSLAILQRQARNNQAEGSSYFLTWFVRFFPVLWMLMGVALLALLAGYIALSYFIAGNLLQTALFIVTMALVHNFADAISEAITNPMSHIGQFLRRFSALGDVGLARLALVFRTGIDILIVVFALPALFLIWAVTWIDVSALYSWLFNGFTVGNITISPSGMLVAVAVLAIGIVITRTLTNWLQRRVLSETTLDKGVQDSVRTATSYVGYIIAASLALTAAGLNFSNIAIIAGALGVGIGFGLQSIVNNFVSGLILLAERPVRVGDWVATNDSEGIVKKINVRSTEIETFDNCTVIVPNSALVSGVVKNWTHRDTVGRFGISVTVRPGVDAQVVADVMKEAARAHPKVLRYPEPQVLLTKFPIQGMEFEVKGHVADVFEAAKVASDIRFAIVAGLRKKKIELVAA